VFDRYEFRSRAPLLGAFFAGVRQFWYNIATRWVLRQQEVYNHQQEFYVRSLETQVVLLSAENSRLATAIAQLATRLAGLEQK
jgi:hypothetical protein